MKIGLVGTVDCEKSLLLNILCGLPQFSQYNSFFNQEQYTQCIDGLDSQIHYINQALDQLINNNFISNCSIYTTIAFTSISKNISANNKLLLNDISKQFVDRYDLIVYVDPEHIITSKKVDLDYRNKLNYVIRHLLGMYPPKKLITVGGSMSSRIQIITKFIDIYTHKP